MSGTTMHTIPVIENDSTQKVDNNVRPKKLNTNSSDHINAKLMVTGNSS
jgi:hypothetical protein